MRLIEKVRTRVGSHLLKQQAKSQSRLVRAINLKDAKSIGILFDAGQERHFKLIKQFIKSFPEGSVEFNLLGFLPDTVTDHNYLSDKRNNFFSAKDCSFFMQPQQEQIQQFIDRKVDLLLVLSLDYHFPLHWVVKLSNAGFKAGLSGVYKEDLDFMIELKDPSIETLIEQLRHYLGDLRSSDRY